MKKEIESYINIQNALLETKELTRVSEIQLPPIGQPLKNVNISAAPGSDPILLPDSEYPEWIWNARGPCRAALRSTLNSDIDITAEENFKESSGERDVARLKKYLRMENRKSIRKNNSMLKGASQ